MSSHLNWLIIRNNHAYLHKKKNITKPFSSEPGNLKNVSSLRYSGLVNKKTIHVAPYTKGKGVVLTYKAGKYQTKPSKNIISTTFKSGAKKTLLKVRKFSKNNSYRKDLMMMALRRASAIQSSQNQSQKGKRQVRKAGKSGKTNKAGKGTKKTE